MTASTRFTSALRLAALMLFGILLTPTSGASTIATAQLDTAPQRTTATAPTMNSTVDNDRLQQMALLASVDSSSFGRAMFIPSSAPAAGRAEYHDQMGLRLPEPGPLSAIIATCALAAFVMIRRSV